MLRGLCDELVCAFPRFSWVRLTGKNFGETCEAGFEGGYGVVEGDGAVLDLGEGGQDGGAVCEDGGCQKGEGEEFELHLKTEYVIVN